jgi:cytochrome c553
MQKKSLIFALTVLFSSGVAPVQAQMTHADSANAGKQKSASCESCHGEHGNSTMPMFPKLAGQHATYLVQQLQAFKSGVRQDPMMGAIAMTLTDEDMTNIANYYSDQKITAEPLADEDDADELKQRDALIAQGADLYRNGDLKREVSACIACHGPYGDGNKPASFPSLKSQHSDYLVKSLNDFKSGKRSNSNLNMMHMIAGKMSDAEIKAVALRISTMK